MLMTCISRKVCPPNAGALSGGPFLALEIKRWLQRDAPLDDGAQRIVQRLGAARRAQGFPVAIILMAFLPLVPATRRNPGRSLD